MAHFVKLDENNIVVAGLVVNNSELDPKSEEESGRDFLNRLFNSNDNWVQTSYNAKFRKHYAAIGFKYDLNLDAFIPPKPFPSWKLNEITCNWESPVKYPNDGKLYLWNEETQNWDEAVSL